MPQKRKRNPEAAVRRKVGRAPKEEAAPAASMAEAAAGTEGSGGQAAATRPLEPIKAEEGIVPAAQDAKAPTPAGNDGASSAPDGLATAEGGDSAPTPKRKSIKGSKKAPKPSGGASSAPIDRDAAEKGAATTNEPAGDEAPKRPSKRKERRAARKKAKADKRARLSRGQRIRRRLRIVLTVVLVLALLAVGSVAGGVAYHRWYAYDDLADIQGTWYISGTDTPVEITGDTIVLTPEVAYRYRLDPNSKAIAFSFGNLDGQGHYRFSLDRQYLVIFDGDYDWERSLSLDAGWLMQALADHLADRPNDLAQGAFYNVTLLSRTSADDSVVTASVVTTPEGPRVVWSAPDAQGATADDADGSDSSPSDAGASKEGAEGAGTSESDVDLLLGDLSDHPAS